LLKYSFLKTPPILQTPPPKVNHQKSQPQRWQIAPPPDFSQKRPNKTNPPVHRVHKVHWVHKPNSPLARKGKPKGTGEKRISPYKETYLSPVISLKKTGINDSFKEYIREIFSNLTIIPKLAIEPESWKRAFELCSDVDPKDTAFIALGIDLDIPLLTRDRKLYNGLKSKDFQNIILLENFLELLDN
jgi:hypothetical protein